MDNSEDAKRLLASSRLFKGFSAPVVETIVPLLVPCHFYADKMICLKGDVSDCLYIVRKGEVEVSISSSEGKIIVLGTLSEGDVFGEVGLLDKGTRTANVTAKTDVSLYRLDGRDFDVLKKLFGVAEFMALTAYICFLFRRAANNLEETVFMDADLRIARKIWELYEKSDRAEENFFKVAISQENLGRMAGLSREATNKALAHLENEGLIKRKYRRITVPDIGRFEQAVHGHSGQAF